MNGTWVLVFWLLAYHGNSPATVVGFTNKEACEKAGKAIVMKYAEYRDRRPSFDSFVCVSKTGDL